MLVVLAVAVAALVAFGVVFDVLARRRGAYRSADHFREAGRQRRSERLNLLHTFYERRTGTGPSADGGPRRRRPPGSGD